MTIAELIAHLEGERQDAVVRVFNDEGVGVTLEAEHIENSPLLPKYVFLHPHAEYGHY